MAEPIQNTTFRFNEDSDGVFKLFALGYDDFRTLETYNFVRKYDWHSLHFVRNGKGRLVMNNKEYRLGAGDFFLIPANVPVMYYRDEEEPWRYYWTAFRKESLFDCNALLGLCEASPIRKSRNPERIISVFDSLFEGASSPGYFLVLAALMQIIDAEHPGSSQQLQLYSPENIIEKTKSIIDMNYMRPDFSVGSICSILYVSRQHLCRLFKKSTGFTPVAYLAEKRITVAARLLREHGYTVHNLAEQCGFSNDAYFMRCFKKRFGTTVGEYRNKLTHIQKDVELL